MRHCCAIRLCYLGYVEIQRVTNSLIFQMSLLWFSDITFLLDWCNSLICTSNAGRGNCTQEDEWHIFWMVESKSPTLYFYVVCTTVFNFIRAFKYLLPSRLHLFPFQNYYFIPSEFWFLFDFRLWLNSITFYLPKNKKNKFFKCIKSSRNTFARTQIVWDMKKKYFYYLVAVGFEIVRTISLESF